MSAAANKMLSKVEMAKRDASLFWSFVHHFGKGFHERVVRLQQEQETANTTEQEH